MDQDFQTSFIPKKPMIEKRTSPSQPVGVVIIISFLILFVVLIASGGLYFYKGVMVKNVEKMKKNLELSKGRFEDKKIAQLQTLDKRLIASKDILDKHISASPIFKALQDITMKSVRYTRFTYEVDSIGNKIIVKMNGQATGYKAVALQSDLFTTKGKHFIDPVFSNLSLNEKGNVLFDLEFAVDPSFVNYKKTITSETIPISDIIPINVEEVQN